MTTASARAFLAFGLAVATLSGAPAAPAAQPADDRPVQISFLAIGRDGAPVTDLKPDEVSLRLNGRSRPIKSLQRIDAAPSTAAAAAAAAPPPFGTNVTASGGTGSRVFYFVIEDATFRPGNERLAKQAVDQFLTTVSSSDRVALVTMPHPMIRTPPTTVAEVRKALDRVAGIAPTSQTVDEAVVRTRTSLEGLRGLLTDIAGSNAQPIVIFLSGGMTGTTRAVGSIGRFTADLASEHFQNVGAAAAAARAQVYVAQADLTVTERSDGLENLAGVVGTQVLMLSPSQQNPLARIAAETSSSYLATFDVDPSERNGQNQRSELRVTRADVTTRAPATFAVPRSLPKTSARTPNPRDMLREATIYRGLPLRVTGFVTRDSGEKLKLVVVGEPSEPGVKLTAAVVGVYDAKGRLTQSTAPPESLATMPVMIAVVVEPGMYRIRLAASDSNGRGGSADYDLQVGLTPAGPLKISSLLLGTNAGGFKPALAFSSEPSATASIEIYGKPGSSLPLRLELAASADGPALQQAQPAGSSTKEADRFLVSGAFQIGGLAPGDYVVRAIVGPPDSEGRVVRTLRKIN